MTSPSKPFLSAQTQLNIIGVLSVVLLGVTAWQLLRPFTYWSILPLIFISYAAFRIIFELTINRGNVPTVATGFIGRKKIAALLRQDASSKKSYTIIDLGSGRGELTRVIAKALPYAQVIGIEIARWPHLQSKLIQRWFGPDNLSYECLDFWTFDCAKINAVVFYLTPNFAQCVGEKLHRELKPGSMVISHTFPLRGDWKPAEILEYRTPFKEIVYIYRKN